MSRTGYLSCASCHLDGEGDNLVWDFTQRGEGLRNTISLEGRAGTGHGPMHWSANFDEVQDFEGDIRYGQGGTGFLPDAVWASGTHRQSLGDPKAGLSPELDRLAAYVSSLSRFGASPHRREGDAAWAASRARGEALFRRADVGCASCHAGERYTDSVFLAPGMPLLHDVGTIRASSGMRLGGALTGLDTPTLRGLWRTAPYLHDGSAATLREVLTTRNAGDRHGVTSTLSPTDLDDLETFLLSIE
jgi:cytochrome c peroxidase